MPIKDERAVYGEIDMGSEHRDAFGPFDRELLDSVASRLAGRIAGAVPISQRLVQNRSGRATRNQIG